MVTAHGHPGNANSHRNSEPHEDTYMDPAPRLYCTCNAYANPHIHIIDANSLCGTDADARPGVAPLQPRDVLVRAADGSVRAARAEADTGAGAAVRESGAAVKTP